jgi:hypothetical protein
MRGISAGFHADTMIRRLSGLFFSVSTTSLIWSIVSPPGALHDRHCLP